MPHRSASRPAKTPILAHDRAYCQSYAPGGSVVQPRINRLCAQAPPQIDSRMFLSSCDICNTMKTLDGATNSVPEIVEHYRDYSPPAKLKEWIENLLESVPTKYTAGLKTVVLTNQRGLTRDQRRQKICAYYRATRSRPATVWLYVDNILESQPRWTLQMPILRYLYVAPVLYHEIGHHIHAVHRPVYEGKENVAEEWSTYLCGQFLRKHYWYARPILYVMWLLIRFMKRVNKRNN
jgi:hypothetical protein